jgi:hypothetical protein
LNLELTKVRNHGHVELKDLYHDRVRILNKLREQIWRENKVEMKAQIVIDVIPIFVAPIPSLLHQNNIGVTYARTSNFRMEPIRYVPLYFVAMSQSIIIVIEAPFVLALVHTIDGVISKSQTPREI